MAWDKDLDKNSSAYEFASNDAKTIRVMAGPGTGKSFGLKRRIARLLEQGINPNRILAVTFTRTAAQDLKDEIQSIEVNGADKVVAKTLHSYCFKMLQKREIITATGRYPRPLLDFELKPMLYDLDSRFGNINEKRKILEKFEASWACLQSDIPGFPENEIEKIFENEIYSWLIKHKAMLFGEMIKETYHYLRDNPLCSEKSDFDYILVDEYQDLNKAEQSVIDYLASNCNLAVIGDDDQSIYSFKYAHPEGIREFTKTHTDCITIDFAECRRCPQKVVQMASRLISHNSNRTLGELSPYTKNQEGDVQIVQCKTLQNEIDKICKTVYDDINNGVIDSKDVLILVPAKKIGKKVRDSLIQLGLSAKTYFSESPLDRDELKYNFSLFTLLSNPNDMVSLRYLLGFGGQSFRKDSYRKLLDYSIKNNMEIKEVLESCLEDNIKIQGINTLVQKYKQIKEQLYELQRMAKEGQDSFINYLTSGIPDSDEFRSVLLESIKECEITEISDLESSLEKIYNIAVEKISRPNVSSDKDHIKIMTLHASKGLSSKYVVVMSAIEGLIPRNGINNDKDNLEEQRRLFYVAITRCKSSENGFPGKLIISSFTRLHGNEALELKINAKANSWKTVMASRFIRDFENTVPPTIVLQ